MKKRITILMICALLLTGCASKLRLPEDAIAFTTKENGEYLSILWDDKEYVPFSAGESDQLGDCIGFYLSEDGTKIYVCELKGQSSEEWIADTSDLNFCNDIMVYKETTVDAIPDEMSSEYEWNQ